MWAILRAVKRGWTQHFVSQLSGLVIMVLTYTAVLFIALALTNMKNIFSVWGKVNQVTVYLNNKVTSEEKKGIKKFLQEHELVKNLNLVSSQEAATNFQSRFSGFSLGQNSSTRLGEFFPSYFKVNLNQEKAYKTSSTLERFALAIKQRHKTVSLVSYGQSWLKKYIQVLIAVENIGWFLISLFMLGSLILSSNVIKTVLFDRREEVEVLEFIGAGDSAIYLPQIINVLFMSMTGFLIALSVNYFAFNIFTQSNLLFSSRFNESLQFLSLGMILSLFLINFLSLGIYSFYTVAKLMPHQKKKVWTTNA